MEGNYLIFIRLDREGRCGKIVVVYMKVKSGKIKYRDGKLGLV